MLKRFALTIWRAMTDARSYVDDFAHRTTGSALGYLYWLLVTWSLLVLLTLAGLAIFITPRIEPLANQHLQIIQDWYPDELIVTISGGVLSTNVNEPYILDIPTEWNDMNNGSDDPAHAIVIDTKGSIDDFADYDTLILLTDKAVVVRDDNGVRMFPYGEEGEPIVIDEALVAGNITLVRDNLVPWLPWMLWGVYIVALLVAPWIVGGAMWLGELLFLLWATAVLWIIAKIIGRNLRYGELYKLGLFGVTNSLALAFIVSLLSNLDVAWIPTIVFFVWMTYVVVQFPRRDRAVIDAPLPPASMIKKTTSPIAAKKPSAPKKARPKTIRP